MFSYGLYPSSFSLRLRCYKVDESSGRDQLNYGGKVLLPSSALHRIMQSNLAESSLMMFQLEHKAADKRLCVGVLEFTAEEGCVIVPSWMYKQLEIKRRENLIDVTTANPELGCYAKFQPMSFDFLDIENPKVILEKALRNYTCINTNDCIEISHCEKVYPLLVKQTKPGDSICVINCNLMVEFEPAPGYEEFQDRLNMNRCIVKIQDKIDKYIEETNASKFQPFQGNSTRLDGKKKKKAPNPTPSLNQAAEAKLKERVIDLQGSTIDDGYPDYNWKVGKLTFDRYFHKRIQHKIDEKKKDEEEANNKDLFPGEGNIMP